MSGGSRCTACQRVSTTPIASSPPMSSETTAATAFQRISFSAGSWNTSPLDGQVRNIRLTLMSPPSLHDVQAAHHGVVVDAAVLVADDRIGARVGRGDGQHVLVAGVHLDVDVLRLQREAVQPVERHEVDAVGIASLELEDRVPARSEE